MAFTEVQRLLVAYLVAYAGHTLQVIARKQHTLQVVTSQAKYSYQI